MTSKLTAIFNTYLKLTVSERNELKTLINDFDKSDYIEKGIITEKYGNEVRRITGPTSGFTCPTCGK